MIGVYKITAPDGKIYVGGSINIKNRWVGYHTHKKSNQVKLFESFKKFDVQNHEFEIIEECQIEILSERESYHGMFFNVLGEHGLNGLIPKSKYCENCTADDVRQKQSVAKSKIVLDLNTGIFYSSVKEAAKAFDFKYDNLISYLNGRCKNKTSLIYA